MSEPTSIDLPFGLRWIKLVCRLGRLVTDSAADENAYPDLVPVSGKLTLSTSPSRVRIQEPDGRWRSVDVSGRTYTIRDNGELVDEEGRVGVYIPDPASLLVEPQGYSIAAVVKPTGGFEWRVTLGGSTVLPDEVDLVAVSSVGSVSPSVTASFDARLYALETGGTLPGGSILSGVVPIFQTLAEAQAWEAANPGRIALHLGGVAPPPDPDPNDTTNPIAGTLSASAQTETGFTLMVTGASDNTALHAQPYAFSTDNGATWSAWQSAPNRAMTGLSAATAYQARHKVRDASGNETVGVAVTVTTASTSLLPASDDFNRADGPLGGTPDGHPWLYGPNAHTVVNNAAEGSSSGTSVSYIDAGTLAQKVSVTILDPTKASGAAVRIATDGTVAGTSLYRFIHLNGTFYLSRNGSLSSVNHLKQWSGAAAAAGDTLTLSVVPDGSATTLSAWHNDTLLGTHTETSQILTGTGVGLFSSGGARLDDFEAVLP